MGSKTNWFHIIVDQFFFFGSNILDLNDFGLRKKFCSENFCIQKNSVPKTFLVWKNVGLEEKLGQKFPKHLWSKKIWGPKKLGSRTILCPNKFGAQNHWAWNIVIVVVGGWVVGLVAEWVGVATLWSNLQIARFQAKPKFQSRNECGKHKSRLFYDYFKATKNSTLRQLS